MSLTKVLCASISFYQGHEVIYNEITFFSQDRQSKIYKKREKKGENPE
jgi:hypothetical protein